MKTGTLLGALVGGIAMFLLGFLLFGVVFADFFRANTMQYAGLAKDPPVIWAILLFNIVWAWLIAWILERSGSGIAEGIKVGAIFMAVLGIGLDIEFHAFMNLHKGITPQILHVVIVAFLGAVAGAIIAFIQGYFARRVATA